MTNMPEERLLERIRSLEREPIRRGSGDQGRLKRSLLSHLQRILNTRQGNVAIAEDYGVPDFTDFLQAMPESVSEIERNIKKAIDKYEPRLSGARVSYLPDEDDVLMLRFQIAATLSAEEGRKILFETVIDADGRVRVRS